MQTNRQGSRGPTGHNNATPQHDTTHACITMHHRGVRVCVRVWRFMVCCVHLKRCFMVVANAISCLHAHKQANKRGHPASMAATMLKPTHKAQLLGSAITTVSGGSQQATNSAAAAAADTTSVLVAHTHTPTKQTPLPAVLSCIYTTVPLAALHPANHSTTKHCAPNHRKGDAAHHQPQQ
jgi:hypothetical protein